MGRHLLRTLGVGVLTALLATGAGAQPRTPRLPAFPGAEGFGAFTVGGRGGTVYLVTTLDDYGPAEEPLEGSLRAAVDAEGPRTVVFRVAGYIDLKRPLEIRHPYLTLAGQTAPGEGVTLRTYGLEIYAPEVIVRYLRVRPGDVASTEQDAVNVRARNVIIDHCSVSWGTDETLSVIGEATNVTVQWCLITESLNQSVHHKGAHGYGSLLTTTGDVTIHHTAYAFHHSRNPRPKDLLLDFRNNLVYGFGDQAGYNYADFTRMNYVGNVVVPLAYSRDPACAFNLGGVHSRFFLEDNLLRVGGEDRRDDWPMVCTPDDLAREAVVDRVRRTTPLAVPAVITHPPGEALRRILEDGGATLPARDAVDRRVIRLIQAGEGRIIDSQADVGGWPPLVEAPPPLDRDRDGMPDAWEAQRGLDPQDGSDHAGDLDGDGYTNLEEYLNGTDPQEPYAWVPPPSIRPASGTAFTDTALTVTITPSTPDVPVYFALDGREPTTASSRYHAPLRLTESTQVRARAIRESAATTTAFAAFEKLTWHEPAALPPGLPPGLRLAYYEADDWDDGPSVEAREPTTVATVPGVDFDIAHRAYGYAFLFDGYLEAPRDGIYRFYFSDNYRGRLYLDGHLVSIGLPPDGAPGQVALRAGKHRFHLRTFHETPGSTPALHWQGPGETRQPIPDRLFFRDPSTK